MTGQIETVLTRARDLVAQPGGWTQGLFAMDDEGADVDPFSLNAGCFCAYGAMMRGTDGSIEMEIEAADFLHRVICIGSIAEWNDAPERTQAEVVAAFDKAIELAREAGV